MKLRVTEPGGITLSGFNVVIEYDAGKFTVGDAQIGTLLTGLGFAGLLTNPASGRLIYTASSLAGSGQLPFNTEGDLFTIAFTIAVSAPPGLASFNLLQSSTSTVTAMFDNDLNDLILSPPTNAATDAVDGWLTVSYDATKPTASIVPVTPDPCYTAVDPVTVNFSELVTGVDADAFRLTRNGTPVSLAGLTVTAVSGTHITLDLSTVTGTSGLYVLTVLASSDVADAAGNPLDADASEAFVVNIHAWQNYLKPEDVNGIDDVTALDVLQIINYINNHGAGPLPMPPPTRAVAVPGHIGNDLVTAYNVLSVINYINSQSGGDPSPEGEGKSESTVTLDTVCPDWQSAIPAAERQSAPLLNRLQSAAKDRPASASAPDHTVSRP